MKAVLHVMVILMSLLCVGDLLAGQFTVDKALANKILLEQLQKQDSPSPHQVDVAYALKSQIEKLKNCNIGSESLLTPGHSDLSPGKVTRHRVTNSQLQNVALYVISDEPQSIHWLEMNKDYLKGIHAIGLITNVASRADMKSITSKLGLPIVPAQLAGFAKLVGTHHYPFLLYQGWVLQ